MMDGINKLGVGSAGGAGIPSTKPGGAGTPGSVSFSDVLKNSIDEVARLQQDASKAVEDVMTGKSEDVVGVMTAMEKSDIAFKTLLAIRGKLMDAYEEIKSISI
jgi:flagellar hook-basal body complex protein FliE